MHSLAASTALPPRAIDAKDAQPAPLRYAWASYLQEQTLPSDSTQSEQTRSAVRSYILFAFGVLLAIALAWQLRHVLTLIYVSALFAVVLNPVVNNIMRFELRNGRSVSRCV